MQNLENKIADMQEKGKFKSNDGRQGRDTFSILDFLSYHYITFFVLDVIPFLAQMATTANTLNPHISTPYVEPMAMEIELEEAAESATESDLASLSFDEGPAV